MKSVGKMFGSLLALFLVVGLGVAFVAGCSKDKGGAAPEQPAMEEPAGHDHSAHEHGDMEGEHEGMEGMDMQEGKGMDEEQMGHEGQEMEMEGMDMHEGMEMGEEHGDWPNPAKGKYVCQMEHDNYYSDEPGDCPKCGMKLVNTEELKAELGAEGK